MRRIVWLWMLMVQSVWAAEVCVTVDTTGWTTRQLSWREAIAYRLAFEAGQNLLPTLHDEAICFTNPTFEVSTVITGQTLLNRMAQQEADNAAELADEESKKTLRRSQLKAMGLNEKEIGKIIE